MTDTMSAIDTEIQSDITQNTICIFSKGTKEQPRCGFTVETMQFFDKYNRPYTLVDVLENPEKRDALNRMTNWPTLPKVFIGGKFYGDTDILDEMAAKGEIEPLLAQAFGE